MIYNYCVSKIRLVYLYLFAAVGLITVIVGTVRMVDLGRKFEIYPSKLPSGQPELTTEEMQVRQDREITRNRSGI